MISTAALMRSSGLEAVKSRCAYAPDVDEEGLDDLTSEIAAAVGMTPVEFARAFGAGWRPFPMSEVDRPQHTLPDPEASGWYVSGDPPQVVLRVTADGIEVGRPKGIWGGHVLEYVPDDVHACDRTQIATGVAADVVRRLASRRRRSFRYCRYCRRLIAPEEKLDDTCHGCATRWEGVIF